MNRQEMHDFIANECLITGDKIKLSAGAETIFYFDCKRATLRGEFLQPLADWILDDVATTVSPPPTIIGGPTMGADFIAAAVILRASQRNLPLTAAAIIRKEDKKHGTRSLMENKPTIPSRILIVEDVITTGSSVVKACDNFIAAGHTISAIGAIIDRQKGGAPFLRQKYNAPVVTLFTAADFGVTL